MADFTNEEFELIDRLRRLAEHDPAFKHITKILIQQLKIFDARGSRYNGGELGVYDHNYYWKDDTAAINSFRATKRLESIIQAMPRMHLSDDIIGDPLTDAINYLLIWKCCRREDDARETGQ